MAVQPGHLPRDEDVLLVTERQQVRRRQPPVYGAAMASSLARSAHNATNSLHSLIYFAPETEHYLTGVGLRGNRMCYFAGRAAPMGAVGAAAWSPRPSTTSTRGCATRNCLRRPGRRS